MKITLASNQQAHLPIVIHPDASSRVLEAANDLREKLNQITSASFDVATGTGETGIYLSVEPVADPFQNGGYSVETHTEGLKITGNSDKGLVNGVWGFLRSLGYRHYFPEDIWEQVPSIPTLDVEASYTEQPSFSIRRGPKEPPWTDSTLWSRWYARNRMGSDVTIRTSHTWHNIVKRNQAIFDANPHFLHGSKFRISAVGEWEGQPIRLIDVVVQDAVRVIQANPDHESISMDPTDGTGWSRDSEEESFKPGEHGYIDPNGNPYPDYDGGHITDRVVFLANEVAKAINGLGLGDKYVGYYSYAAHKQAPNIPVHHMHVVSIVSGFTIVAPDWVAKGCKHLGAYNRLHLVQHHRGDLPVPSGGDIRYAENTIPALHSQNCKVFLGDSYDSWGINGLPYYLIAQRLWDVEVDIEDEVDMFLANMFSGAEVIVRDYFDMINRKYDYPPRTRQDYIARGYRILQDAYQKATDETVRERIDYLTIYLYYVELYHHHSRDGSSQTTGETMMRHAYRMTQRQLSLVTAMYRHYVERSDRPMEPTYYQMEAFDYKRPMTRMNIGGTLKSIMPWADATPFTKEEIGGMRLMGIENFEPEDFGFEPKEFSNNLYPATPLELTARRFGLNMFSRGSNSCYLWLEEGVPFYLLARNIDVREGTVLILYLESEKEVLDEPVASAVVPAGGQWHEVILHSPYSGKHLLKWNAHSDWGHITWPDIKVTGSTNPDADGLYSRANQWDWRNGKGWRIYRGGSSWITYPWKLNNPDGDEQDTTSSQGGSPHLTLGWTGVFKNAVIERWQEQKAVWEFSPNDPYNWDRSKWLYFFYVPKGTQVVGGVFTNHVETNIYYPDGTEVQGWRTEDGNSGPFAIDVPEGMDGLLWEVSSTRGGRRSLLTVPPYVARSVEELLLPKEVIEADAGIELPGDEDDYISPEPEEPPDEEEPPVEEPKEPAYKVSHYEDRVEITINRPILITVQEI